MYGNKKVCRSCVLQKVVFSVYGNVLFTVFPYTEIAFPCTEIIKLHYFFNKNLLTLLNVLLKFLIIFV